MATRLALNLLGSPIRLLWGERVYLAAYRRVCYSAALPLAWGGRLSRLAGSLGKIGESVSRAETGKRRACAWMVMRCCCGWGEQLMFTPIGLGITAIAAGAYLIYRYWTPISAFFFRLFGGARANRRFTAVLRALAHLSLLLVARGLFYIKPSPW